MQPLKSGDTIGVISPASKAEAEVFLALSAMAAQRGYKIKIFGNEDHAIGRMAAEDAERARHLMDAFADDTVRMVLCARGGYGSGRILDLLDMPRITPKIFVGYSDITSLLIHLNAHASLTTFHGPMASDLSQKSDPETLDWFFSFLEGRRLDYKLELAQPQVCKTGHADGPLWGGNISMITSLLGTNSIHIPDGGILLLEDVNEFMYSFDRSLVQLKRAGIFESAAAILFADLKLRDGGARDNSLGLLLEEVIEMNLSDFDGPIVTGLPCGHTERQMTIPLGAQAHLSVSENSLSLSFDDFWTRDVSHHLAA